MGEERGRGKGRSYCSYGGTALFLARRGRGGEGGRGREGRWTEGDPGGRGGGGEGSPMGGAAGRHGSRRGGKDPNPPRLQLLR